MGVTPAQWRKTQNTSRADILIKGQPVTSDGPAAKPG
jgi:hypothetical protein